MHDIAEFLRRHPPFDTPAEGEMFGFASLLEEGPLGFVARAEEDTLGATTVADRLYRAFTTSPGRKRLLACRAAAAMAQRPPTGFLRATSCCIRAASARGCST